MREETTKGGGHFDSEITAPMRSIIPQFAPPGKAAFPPVPLPRRALDPGGEVAYNKRMDTFPREDGALIALHEATAGGVMLGSRLVIPTGYAGVVVKDGKPLDTLAAGDHLLEPSLLPGLMQSVRGRGAAARDPSGAALPAAVFLVPVGTPTVLPWRKQAVLSKSVAYGLTYTALAGRCEVQVTDPARFCGAVFAAGSKALSAGEASPAQVAAAFLSGGVGARAGEAVQVMGLPPDQAVRAREAIRSAAGQAAAEWLAGAGVLCTLFDLDSVAEPDRTPCAGCGSQVAPTGYGVFHRTISLLYIRFTAKKEGNFCVPCAWKIGGGYSGATLVLGWWGLIGLVTTPVYLAQNLYYLTRIVSGPKAVPRQGPPAPVEEGV